MLLIAVWMKRWGWLASRNRLHTQWVAQQARQSSSRPPPDTQPQSTSSPPATTHNTRPALLQATWWTYCLLIDCSGKARRDDDDEEKDTTTETPTAIYQIMSPDRLKNIISCQKLLKYHDGSQVYLCVNYAKPHQMVFHDKSTILILVGMFVDLSHYFAYDINS